MSYVAHNNSGHLLGTNRYDGNGFALIETDDDLICYEGAYIRRNKGQYGQFEVKHISGSHKDEGVKPHDDVTHLQVVELLGNGTDNIEASRVAVVTINNTHADTV